MRNKRGVWIFYFLILLVALPLAYCENYSLGEHFLSEKLQKVKSLKQVEEAYDEVDNLGALFYVVSGFFYTSGDKEPAKTYLKSAKSVYESLGNTNMSFLIDHYLNRLDSSAYKPPMGGRFSRYNLSFSTDSIYQLSGRQELRIEEIKIEPKHSMVNIQLRFSSDFPGAYLFGNYSDECLVLTNHAPHSYETEYLRFSCIKKAPADSKIVSWNIRPMQKGSSLIFGILIDSGQINLSDTAVVSSDKGVVLKYLAAEPLSTPYLYSADRLQPRRVDVPFSTARPELLIFEITPKQSMKAEVQRMLVYYAVIISFLLFIIFNYLGVTLWHMKHARDYFLLIIAVSLPFFIYSSIRWMLSLLKPAYWSPNYFFFVSCVLAATLLSSLLGYIIGNYVSRQDAHKSRVWKIKKTLNNMNRKEINDVLDFLGIERMNLREKRARIHEILKLEPRELKELYVYIREKYKMKGAEKR